MLGMLVDVASKISSWIFFSTALARRSISVLIWPGGTAVRALLKSWRAITLSKISLGVIQARRSLFVTMPFASFVGP
ncbi:MAG: hypothetical protein IPK39_16290 [Sulfuritalea sp.]|nr:hypothetical protein [Sulfuritalea sp.]